MGKVKIIISIIFIILGLILMDHYLVPTEEESNCLRYHVFNDLNLDGIVINKYYDKHQHSNPTIEVMSIHNSDSVQKIYLVLEHSDLFNLLSISDTILKEKHSDIVLRKVNGVFIKLAKADFGCKQP